MENKIDMFNYGKSMFRMRKKIKDAMENQIDIFNHRDSFILNFIPMNNYKRIYV